MTTSPAFNHGNGGEGDASPPPPLPPLPSLSPLPPLPSSPPPLLPPPLEETVNALDGRRRSITSRAMPRHSCTRRERKPTRVPSVRYARTAGLVKQQAKRTNMNEFQRHPGSGTRDIYVKLSLSLSLSSLPLSLVSPGHIRLRNGTPSMHRTALRGPCPRRLEAS